MFRFNLHYFLASIFIFIIEVIIAVYVHDDFVRPFVGDILVVILLYCFLRAFTIINVTRASVVVLVFSFVVEILQYLDFVNLIGLAQNKFARIVIGTSFSWWDLVCYTVGFVLIIIIEKGLKLKS